MFQLYSQQTKMTYDMQHLEIEMLQIFDTTTHLDAEEVHYESRLLLYSGYIVLKYSDTAQWALVCSMTFWFHLAWWK